MADDEKSGTAERPILMSIRRSAQVTDLSPSYIRKRIDEGDLKATRIGRRVLIKTDDLLAWINRNDDPTAAVEGDHQEAA
jgi:excisionase family DNA binding protein